MDVATLIASFLTGSYSVTRRARSTFTRGRAVDGASSTLTIDAAIVPATGGDMMRLPEGRRTNETRAIFTTTQLMMGGQDATYEADRITVDGEPWEVQHSEVWRDPSSRVVGYRALVQAMR